MNQRRHDLAAESRRRPARRQTSEQVLEDQGELELALDAAQSVVVTENVGVALRLRPC